MNEQTIHIESRNCDGMRLEHTFPDAQTMLQDWDSENPTMGDNEILLVSRGNQVLFCSIGRKHDFYADTVRTKDVMDWFRPIV